MKEENVIVLIHKRLLGTITADETAILETWIGRAPENLDFVEQTELVWELSQTKTTAFQPNTQVALGRFKQRLEAEKAPTANVVSMASGRRRLIQIAGIAAAIAGVFLVWNNFMVSETTWQSVTTLDGEQKEIKLDDGTIVWLNENSTLDYAAEFATNRKIKLNGEAFFDVAKDAAHPFSIETKEAGLKVLGTSFNVRSYDEDAEMVVAVRTGKVQFQPLRSSQKWVLEAKDKIAFDISRKTYRKTVDETANEWSWQSQQLQFKKTKLKEVISSLERHYGFKISLSNIDLYECRNYTGSFNSAPIEVILNTISVALDLKVVKAGDDTYKLTGGKCQ